MGEEKKNEMVEILDGQMIEVKFRDAAKLSERLKVRRIPICDIDQLARVFGQNPAQETTAYIEKDVAFVKSLSDDSFVEVYELGRKLNFPSCEKWFAWQEQTLRAMHPGQGAGLVEAVTQKVMAAQRADN